MKVYLAGNSQYVSIWEWIAKHHKQALLSYHYIAIESQRFWGKTIKEMIRANNKVDLFLDSGAFSAWSQGKNINIEQYIQFIKTNQSIIGEYANLDVIGDPKATWENQMIMEKAGLHPIPCFHYGEDEKWIKKLLDRNYDYIALGGMVPISTEALFHWLDMIFSKYITNDCGLPVIKVHGFGLTSLRLMLRYPWYSVDSTSWVVTGRMGSIFIPKFKNNSWVYDEDAWKIAVSGRSPSCKEAGKHITTLTNVEKKILLDYIHSKGYVLGKSKFEFKPVDYQPKDNEHWIEKKDPNGTVRLLEVIEEEGISNNYKLRDEMNIIYFMDLEKSIQPWPWKWSMKNKNVGFAL